MADVDFNEFDGGYDVPGASRMQRVVNLAGAATSVALVVGLGVWGYNLAVRDVAGIPVVRALEGPMRVAPQNPGGEIADHMGLAVNDIAAEGTAAPPADRLVLAPRPVDLAAEDAAGLVAPAPIVAEPVAMAAPLTNPAAPVMPEVAAPVLPLATEDAVAMALAEALSEGVEPLSDIAEPVAEDVAALTTEAAPETTALSVPVTEATVLRSPRPVSRPSAGAAGGAASEAAVAEGPSTSTAGSGVELDPATLEVGTRLIQLGAFDTADQAREEWGRLQARFSELLAGKALVVQAAESGGRTFYRLRAHGFASEDDARRFCSALLSENAACIPVAHR